MAARIGSVAMGAPPLPALDPQPAEAVHELGIGNPGGLHQLGVHARGGETGHGVQLVHEHGFAVHEEIDAGETLAAGVRERGERELPYTGASGGEIRAGITSCIPPCWYLAV